MTPKDFQKFKQKFCYYADGFIKNSTEPGPLQLKKDHTMRVCKEILLLGQAIGLDEYGLLLAQTMALFHDLGRFPQYEIYKTFLDKKSEDHAELSLAELEKHNMIDLCAKYEKKIIQEAVRYHNAADLPSHLNDVSLFFAKLLRDADKLDIWRVVIENYTAMEPENSKAVNLGLVDDGKYSDGALKAIFDHTFVRSNMISSLNDLKLMQISWVFDLNFAQTSALVKERAYIEKIASTMPTFSAISEALEHVYLFLEDKQKEPLPCLCLI